MEEIKKHKELDFYFRDMDHTDIKTIEGSVSLRHFISGMLSYYPWWLLVLYKIREIIVIILGLTKHEKPEVLPSIKPEDLSFVPGENATFFIVRNAKEDIYWAAETPDDTHLKAYFGVAAEKLSDSRLIFHIFTSVKYVHWTGPVYFNLIRPFHHLVIRRMMVAGIKH